MRSSQLMWCLQLGLGPPFGTTTCSGTSPVAGTRTHLSPITSNSEIDRSSCSEPISNSVAVGFCVGIELTGACEGAELLGACVVLVGESVGIKLGAWEGIKLVGEFVGIELGDNVGWEDGDEVGIDVGSSVGPSGSWFWHSSNVAQIPQWSEPSS